MSSSSSLRFDPELAAAISPSTSIRLRDTYTSLPDARDHVNHVFGSPLAHLPTIPGIKKTILHYPSLDDPTTTLEMHRFDPPPPPPPSSEESPPSSSPTKSILYLYGGGLFAGSLDLWSPVYPLYAAMSGCPVFVPSYRQPDENGNHKYPIPVDDCYAALIYLHSNSSSFGLDPSKIAIFGASAGALLAASVAIRVASKRRQGEEIPNPAKLILDMPALDDRTGAGGEAGSDEEITTTPSDKSHPLHPFLTWNLPLTRLMWDVYLGKGHQTSSSIPPEASPSRASPEDLIGFPPTWLSVGGLDLFASEISEFASKLIKAGVEVELKVTPGLPHAGAMWAPLSSMAQEGNEALGKVLRSF